MTKEIVEIHLRTDKTKSNCDLTIIGEGMDLVAMLVAAMSADQTFKEMVEMAFRVYDVYNEQKPNILDHKN